MSDAPEARNGAPWRDGLGLGLAALAVYLLLGQDTLYKVDAQGIVKALAVSDTVPGSHNLHLLFMPVLRAIDLLLSPLGLGAYRTACVASAIGTALGVLFTHRAAAALGCPRPAAAAVTCLVASCPAILFFATIVEFHGVYFGFAGLAWWLMARLVEQPSMGRAVLLGAGTGLAALAHGTGQLLPVLLLGFALAEGRARAVPLPRLSWLLAAAAATHVGLGLEARLLGAPVGNQAEFWGLYLAALPAAGQLPVTLWNEWLRPYAPLSVLWLVALGPAARQAGALAVALSCHVATCWILLRTDVEMGAYQAPLAIAAALLAWRAVPGRWLWPLAVFGLGMGLGLVRRHDVERAPPELVADLRLATAAQQPVFLAGSIGEVNALVRWAPELEFHPFYDWLGVLAVRESEGQGDAALQVTGAVLEAFLARGRAVYLLPGAMELLRGYRALPVTERLYASITARYRCVEVTQGAFHAWRLARP